MSVTVDVQAAPGLGGVPSQARFQYWAEAVPALSGRPTELSVRVVDAPESAALNERYRHKSGPTNVLSFPAELPVELALPLLGDLVICAPVVAREARDQGKAGDAHWAHMVVHGVLHLLGHDHVEVDEARAMEELERGALASLGFPDPYILDTPDTPPDEPTEISDP